MTEDERAIRELVATWMAASRAGDLDTVLGLMTEDVVFMVPGREPFGKEAFAAQSRRMARRAPRGHERHPRAAHPRRLGLHAQPHRDLPDPAGRKTAAPRRRHAHDPAQGSGRTLAPRAGCEFAERGDVTLALRAQAMRDDGSAGIISITASKSFECSASFCKFRLCYGVGVFAYVFATRLGRHRIAALRDPSSIARGSIGARPFCFRDHASEVSPDPLNAVVEDSVGADRAPTPIRRPLLLFFANDMEFQPTPLIGMRLPSWRQPSLRPSGSCQRARRLRS